MLLVKTIEIPIYHLDVVVCVTDNLDEPIRKFKLDLEKGDYKDAAGFAHDTHEAGKLRMYLAFDHKSLDYDTVLHELTHLTSYLLIHRGIKWDENNDEPMAYFNGYVGNRVLKIIDEFKKILKVGVKK